MKIKNKLQLYKEFGFKVAFSSFCSSAFRHPMAITRWKDRCIINWLKKNYAFIIEDYHKKFSSEIVSENYIPIIWSVWWQGENNMPEIVKLCFESINKNKGFHQLKIITKHNYKDYINLPQYIIDKVENNIMSFAHFSDILRVYLLYHYGGLWLDATMFVADKIPDDIFNYEYFSVKSGFNPKSYAVTMGRWTSFLQAAKKGNLLCGFALDFHLEYWKNQNFTIDYILIDYIFALAYQEFPECKKILDDIPINNKNVEKLQPLLNSIFDEKQFQQLKASTNFFKLTWKQKFEKIISGHETFYGYLLRRITDFTSCTS